MAEAPKDERRRDWDFGRRLAVLETRADKAEEKLDQIIAILQAGKIGAAVIKWLAVLGSTWLAYLTFHNPPK